MSYLSELREREHARKLSRTWAAAQSGRSGLPTQMFPTRQSGSGQPSVGTQVPAAGPVLAADPWAISVTTGVQSFAAAGTLASFTGEKAGPVTVGFAPTFPTDTLTVGKPGTYRLDLSHRWATYQGGGTLSVLVNGEVEWGPDSETYGGVFITTVNLGLLALGDEVTVSVGPTAGTEDGTLVASLVLVEPAVPVVRCQVWTVEASRYGPVAWWRLGEESGTVAADEQGAHPGTYVGTPTLGVPGLVTGDPDLAFDTNGATGHVEVVNDAAFDVREITLEAWVKPDLASLPNSTGILGHGESGYGSFGSTAAYSWGLFQDTSGKFTFAAGRTSGGVSVATSPTAAVAGQTYHVVGTYDGQATRLYVNGELVTETPDVFTLRFNGGDAFPTIGRRRDSTQNRRFRGTIDEATVHGQALDAATIACRYSAGVGGAA